MGLCGGGAGSPWPHWPRAPSPCRLHRSPLPSTTSESGDRDRDQRQRRAQAPSPAAALLLATAGVKLLAAIVAPVSPRCRVLGHPRSDHGKQGAHAEACEADRGSGRGAGARLPGAGGRARAAAEEPVYLVGGAVRDLLLGRRRADVDLVVEGDAAALAERLGADPVVARALRHGQGAPRRPRDRHRRGADRVLRAPRRAARGRAGRWDRGRPRPPRLHDQRDGDPAARGARADRPSRRARRPRGRAPARPAPALLRGRPDPGDPRGALRLALRLRARGRRPRRCCGRPTSTRSRPIGARRSCGGLRPNQPRRADSSCSPSGVWWSCARRGGSSPRVSRICSRHRPGARSLPASEPSSPPLSAPPAVRASWRRRSRSRPSEAVELARGHGPVELVLARALGAEWLDRYLTDWRSVTLEIDGGDLIAAGVDGGPGAGARPAGGAASQARRRDRGSRRGAGRGARGRPGRVGAPRPAGFLLCYSNAMA